MIYLLKKYNTHLIFTSVILAIIFGIYTPQFCIGTKFLGDIFINLLKLFALPLIASTLIVTLGNIGKNLNNFKSLVRGIMSYMLLSELIAVTIALLLFNAFAAGKGVNPNLILQSKIDPAYNIHGLNLDNFLLAIFPQNIFESLAKFDLLPIVIFSTLFGIGCAITGKTSRIILKICSATRDISNTCLRGVMLLSPLGIFALISCSVANTNINGQLQHTFTALISFVLLLVIGLLIHALWQLSLAVITTKQNPWHILHKSLPMLSTAFATSSSVATLPSAMHTADNLQAKPAVTRLMLPICAAINVGGMMMYEVAATLFFSQVLGADLSLTQQMLLAFASILGGMAEGGIPETSLVSLVVVFRIVNIPLSAISILLPLDRILDRLRTMINIFGNMCGTIIVSKFVNINTQEKH